MTLKVILSNPYFDILEYIYGRMRGRFGVAPWSQETQKTGSFRQGAVDWRKLEIVTLKTCLYWSRPTLI